MAYGVPVIGTALAFRGVNVQHGVHALICDRFEEYSTIIRWLSQNRIPAREMGKKARALAASYDYRITYKPYIEFLEGFRLAG